MVEQFGQWWREAAFARRRPFLIKRARLNKALRAWFEAEDFVEVETAALQVSPGLEPHLNAFGTDIVAPDGRSSRLYLHTSPEYAMKKLLVAGEPRIFQLARVWRNGERSATHHPEFTMLEWYRAGEPYSQLMADCAGLVQAALSAPGESALRWRGVESDPTRPGRC
jgi:lysyl-tRNA synthetase class 2